MADNVQITAGSGTSVASNEVVDGTLGTVKVQYVKIMDGTIAGTTKAAVSTRGLKADAGVCAVKSLTLSLDTAIYATGDVLAETQQYDAFFRLSDGTGIIQSVTVIDEDDQGQGFDIYLFKANNSLGTENAAPSISDASARDIQGIISISSGDFKDLGGVKVACIKSVGLPVMAVSGTDDLYVGCVVTSGTPTYTASGIKLLFGVLLD